MDAGRIWRSNFLWGNGCHQTPRSVNLMGANLASTSKNVGDRAKPPTTTRKKICSKSCLCNNANAKFPKLRLHQKLAWTTAVPGHMANGCWTSAHGVTRANGHNIKRLWRDCLACGQTCSCPLSRPLMVDNNTLPQCLGFARVRMAAEKARQQLSLSKRQTGDSNPNPKTVANAY